jgi:hypothetical protein
MTPEQAEKIIRLLEAIDAKLGAPSNLAFRPNPTFDNAAPTPAPGYTFTMVVGAP